MKTAKTPGARRDLWIVAGFVLLTFLPFAGKAYTVDETYFLSIARHILQDPLHPQSFLFNWFGRSELVSRINTVPTMVCYILAPLLKWSRGAEWTLRTLCLPFDLLSALALYLLAARFLSRPLLPALIVLACPGYLINIQLLTAEKWMAAFGFAGLYALVRGLDDNRPLWVWLSAAALAASFLSKYTAVFFLAPAVFYLWHKRQDPSRIALYIGLALAPMLLDVLTGILENIRTLGAIWRVTSGGAAMPWGAWSHRLRSLLAFIGGCGLALAVWPYTLYPDIKKLARAAVPCIALCLLLFLPALDMEPVRLIDRLTGILLASGALLALARLWQARVDPPPGWGLWMSWALGVAALQGLVYWSIVARYVLFLVPPLSFALCALLERSWDKASLARLYAYTLAGVLAFSLCLGLVDQSYAGAQRSLAQRMRDYVPRGKEIWFAGHWGLQYYMEAAGALALDENIGGWDAVKPGDVVVVPTMNANIVRPRRRILSNTRTIRIDSPIPLRLISGRGAQGGFYSSSYGFLPYSISRAPLEEFTIVEPL